MSVEVAVTRDELVTAGAVDPASPRETEKYIIHRLKTAGIPVRGEAFFLGIEYGELIVRAEPDFAGWKFRWRR